MIIRRVQFHQNFYQRGRVKYAKGRDYPMTDEVRSQILAGNASFVTQDAGPVGWAIHHIQTYFAERRIRRERRATIQAEQRL